MGWPEPVFLNPRMLIELFRWHDGVLTTEDFKPEPKPGSVVLIQCDTTWPLDEDYGPEVYVVPSVEIHEADWSAIPPLTREEFLEILKGLWDV